MPDSEPVPPAPPPPPDLPRPPEGGFDLGSVLAAAFRDPLVFRKFVLGCIAVLFIPFFGVGLLALLGFMARSVRKALEGAEHPLADWNDMGGLLVDGVRVIAAALVWIVAGFAAGGLFFAMFAMLGGILGSTGLAIFAAVVALGGVIAVGVLVAWGVLMHVLFQAALLRMIATDSVAEAFRFDAIFKLVGDNLRVQIYLILTLLLVGALGGLSVLPCVVGAIPGAFWAFATYGVAIGHAGRVMEVAPSKP